MGQRLISDYGRNNFLRHTKLCVKKRFNILLVFMEYLAHEFGLQN